VAGLSYLFFSPAYAEDPYMDALNAEAEDLQVDPGTESEQQRTNIPGGSFTGGWDREGQSMSDGLERGLDQADFEDALEEGYYGSFIFYKNLNTGKQEQVYKAYQQGADIDGLRDLIIQLKKMN
jgi:hypothetical protein